MRGQHDPKAAGVKPQLYKRYLQKSYFCRQLWTPGLIIQLRGTTDSISELPHVRNFFLDHQKKSSTFGKIDGARLLPETVTLSV